MIPKFQPFLCEEQWFKKRIEYHNGVLVCNRAACDWEPVIIDKEIHPLYWIYYCLKCGRWFHYDYLAEQKRNNDSVNRLVSSMRELGEKLVKDGKMTMEENLERWGEQK